MVYSEPYYGYFQRRNMLEWLKDPVAPVYTITGTNLFKLIEFVHRAELPIDRILVTKPVLVIVDTDQHETLIPLEKERIELRPGEPYEDEHIKFVINEDMFVENFTLKSNVTTSRVGTVHVSGEEIVVRTKPIDFKTMMNLKERNYKFSPILNPGWNKYVSIYSWALLIHAASSKTEDAGLKLEQELVKLPSYEHVATKPIKTVYKGNVKIVLSAELWRNEVDSLLFGKIQVEFDSEPAQFAGFGAESFGDINEAFLFLPMPEMFVVATGSEAEQIFANPDLLERNIEGYWYYFGDVQFYTEHYLLVPASYTSITTDDVAASLNARNRLKRKWTDAPKGDKPIQHKVIAEYVHEQSGEVETREIEPGGNMMLFVDGKKDDSGLNLVKLRVTVEDTMVSICEIARRLNLPNIAEDALLADVILHLGSAEMINQVHNLKIVVPKLVAEAVNYSQKVQPGLKITGFMITPALTDGIVRGKFYLLLTGKLGGKEHAQIYGVLHIGSQMQAIFGSSQDLTLQAWKLILESVGELFEHDNSLLISNEFHTYMFYYQPETGMIKTPKNELITIAEIKNTLASQIAWIQRSHKRAR